MYKSDNGSIGLATAVVSLVERLLGEWEVLRLILD